MHSIDTRSAAKRRGALLSMELVIALPILLIVILGAVEFTFLLLASQAITAAASVGTRQATLPSASSLQVQNAVLTALGSWRWANVDDLRVRIYVDQNEDGFANELVFDSHDTTLNDDAGLLAAAPTGANVQVTLDLPAVVATPDLLGMLPVLSIQDQQLTASFVSRKE